MLSSGTTHPPRPSLCRKPLLSFLVVAASSFCPLAEAGTCAPVTCSNDPGWIDRPDRNSMVCLPDDCVRDQCCHVTCSLSGITACPAGSHMGPDFATTSCSSHLPLACSAALCCTPDTPVPTAALTCASHACGSGRREKPSPSTVLCPGSPAACTDDACCDYTCEKVECAAGTRDKANNAAVVCSGGPCTNDACCDTIDTCETYTCEVPVWKMKTGPASSRECPSGGCTNVTCCDPGPCPSGWIAVWGVCTNKEECCEGSFCHVDSFWYAQCRPETTAPKTPTPPTAAPTAVPTAVPPTAAPTAAPTSVPTSAPTGTPATPIPPATTTTAAPPTQAPSTTASPPLGASARQGTSGKTIPGPAGDVVATLSVVSAAAAGRMALLAGSGDCKTRMLESTGANEDLPWTLHPLQIEIAGSMWIGAVVGNMAICAGCSLLAYLLLVATRCMLPSMGARMKDVLDTQGLLRLPSSLLFVFMILYQGTSLASLRLIVSATRWYYHVVGVCGAAVCVAVPLGLFFAIRYGVPRLGRYRVDTTDTSHMVHPAVVFFIGRGEWVSTTRKCHWVQRYSSAIRNYKQRYVWWSCVDYLSMLLLSGASAARLEKLGLCCGFKVGTALILAALFVASVVIRPYHRARDNILCPLILLLQTLSVCFIAAGFCSGMNDVGWLDDSVWLWEWADRLLMISSLVLVLKVMTDLLCELALVCTDRRHKLQQREDAAFKDPTTPEERASPQPVLPPKDEDKHPLTREASLLDGRHCTPPDSNALPNPPPRPVAGSSSDPLAVVGKHSSLYDAATCEALQSRLPDSYASQNSFSSSPWDKILTPARDSTASQPLLPGGTPWSLPAAVRANNGITLFVEVEEPTRHVL